MNRIVILGLLSGMSASSLLALSPTDQVKINEIYFAGTPSHETQDGFVELYNAGDDVAFLDGALIAQGVDTFAQLGFEFPGEPGETNLPMQPGEFVLMAIDAYNFSAGDPASVDLSNANFETFNDLELPPGDNPFVPNMVDGLQVGFDWFFVPDWGQVLLATGTDWWVRPCQPGEACGNIVIVIPLETIVDGVEYLRALGDTLPILNDAIDRGAILGIPMWSGQSGERSSPGADTDDSSVDFVILGHPTPGYQTTTDADDRTPFAAPGDLRIESISPNPFNSSAAISFTLPATAETRLIIYDLLGREVSVLNRGILVAGSHRLIWNGRTTNGNDLPGGMYFAQVSARNLRDTAKLLYLK